MSSMYKRTWNWSQGQGFATNKERHAIHAKKKQDKVDKVYAGAHMPDEEVIRRNERRKAAKRRGSRISTVLTDEDTLG